MKEKIPMLNPHKAIHFTEINSELFETDALEWAKYVSDITNKYGQPETGKNKYTQIRRFYDDIDKLFTKSQKLKNLPEADQAFTEQILPFFYLIPSKVAYAEGRKLITEEFVQFTEATIVNSQVKSIQELEHCKLFWEAFMGFYRRYRKQ